MSQYLRIVRKGKLHTRIELPDHSTTQIPTDQLDRWSLAPEDERPPQPVNPNPQKRYIKILRKCKHNVRIQLPDWTTMLISVDDLPEWELVDSNNASADCINENVAENLDEEIAEVFNSGSVSSPVSTSTQDSADNSVSDEVKSDSDSEVCTAPDTPISFEDEVVENNVVEELPKEILELTPPKTPKVKSSNTTINTNISLPKYKVVNGYYFNSKSGWMIWLITIDGIRIPFRVDSNKLKELSLSTENRIDLTYSEIEEIQNFFDLAIEEVDNTDSSIENTISEPLILTPPTVEVGVEVVKKKRGRPRKNPVVDTVVNTNLDHSNEREIIDLSNPPVGNDPSVEDKPKKKRGRKPKNVDGEVPKKSSTFRRNTNGLGTDHPYETVNMDYETIEYEKGVEAPF